MEREFERLFDDIIKKRDLYGRSFTYGVALYIAMTEGWLNEDLQGGLDDLLQAYYYDLFEDIKKHGIDITYNYKAIAELLDVATLDSIARELAGEEE